MRLGRLLAVPLVLVAPLGLAACGESSQEKARKQVCAASSEISKQLTKLEGLPINTSFPTEAVTSLEAIAKSLKEVKSAAPNLEPARKEEVEAGTKGVPDADRHDHGDPRRHSDQIRRHRSSAEGGRTQDQGSRESAHGGLQTGVRRAQMLVAGALA